MLKLYSMIAISFGFLFSEVALANDEAIKIEAETTKDVTTSEKTKVDPKSIEPVDSKHHKFYKKMDGPSEHPNGLKREFGENRHKLGRGMDESERKQNAEERRAIKEQRKEFRKNDGKLDENERQELKKQRKQHRENMKSRAKN